MPRAPRNLDPALRKIKCIRTHVDEHFPANAQQLFPSKRVILDATEVPIQRPAHRNAQRVAFWRVTDEMLRKKFTSKVLLAVPKHSKF